MIHAGSCIVNVPPGFSLATIVGSAKHVRRSETCPIGAFWSLKINPEDGITGARARPAASAAGNNNAASGLSLDIRFPPFD